MPAFQHHVTVQRGAELLWCLLVQVPSNLAVFPSTSFRPILCSHCLSGTWPIFRFGFCLLEGHIFPWAQDQSRDPSIPLVQWGRSDLWMYFRLDYVTHPQMEDGLPTTLKTNHANETCYIPRAQAFQFSEACGGTVGNTVPMILNRQESHWNTKTCGASEKGSVLLLIGPAGSVISSVVSPT